MRTSPVNLRTSDAGLRFIADREAEGGAVLHAYDDADPTARPIKPGEPVNGTLTIGYGHTRTAVAGMTITDAEALALLRTDIRDAEAHVHRNVKCPLEQYEFDALVSLIFNVGPGQAGGKAGIITLRNGEPSSLLRCLNDATPDYAGAANWFTAWKATRGFELGLFRRRIAEMVVFMGLPYKKALNACRSLQFTIAEAVRLAEEERDDLAALQPPAPKPAPQDAPIGRATGGASSTSGVAPPTNPSSAPSVSSKPTGAGETVPRPTVPRPPEGPSPLPLPKKPVSYPERIDIDGNLKPIEQSQRAHGYVWQSVGICVLGFGAAGAFGSSFAAVFEIINKSPAVSNAVLMLFVSLATGAVGYCKYSYGCWKRRRGEDRATQGLR